MATEDRARPAEGKGPYDENTAWKRKKARDEKIQKEREADAKVKAVAILGAVDP